MKIKLGVDSFIWTENFSEKDLWIIPKAKELGFAVSDDMPAEIYQFMSYFPQPKRSMPAVQYVPVPYRREAGDEAEESKKGG